MPCSNISADQMEEIGSGAILDQDKMFLAGGKATEGDKIVMLRAN